MCTIGRSSLRNGCMRAANQNDGLFGLRVAWQNEEDTRIQNICPLWWHTVPYLYTTQQTHTIDDAVLLPEFVYSLRLLES